MEPGSSSLLTSSSPPSLSICVDIFSQTRLRGAVKGVVDPLNSTLPESSRVTEIVDVTKDSVHRTHEKIGLLVVDGHAYANLEEGRGRTRMESDKKRGGGVK